MRKLLTLATVLVLVVASGWPAAGRGSLEVRRPWARPGNRGANSAIYLEIHNSGGQPDRLVSAATDVARAVELHNTVMDRGMHRMVRVQSIAVPANGEVVLRPGGFHVMLIGLTRRLHVGDRFSLTLRFQRTGRLTVSVEVREQAGGGRTH
ncbi:MAG: copper chaperone PCu(A)C [Armatimonadota bacterium]|nr:copper chaperone PCu(A)C [Armatimonadota bacterium]MDR5696084.1 copper chaperone PCu(A)C [Armatimonadota bacterium]